MSRYETLQSLCEIVVNGQIVHKLDFLGTITIGGCQYFNVYRRYNNVYEIVLEDFYGDFHFHRDYTVAQSMQRVLCLSNDQIQGIYTEYGVAFKTQSPIHEEMSMLHWSEIQHRWNGAEIHLGGILESYHTKYHVKQESDDMEEATQQETQQAPLQAPLKACLRTRVTHTPAPKDAIRGTNLSDRFREVSSQPRLARPLDNEYMLLRNGTRVGKPHM